VMRGKQLFVPAPRRDHAAALFDFLHTMWPPAQE
jgi:hypothetical protein